MADKSDFAGYKVSRDSDLIPYIGNARTHSEEQIKQIASSIKEFGFLSPIVTDGENGILAGHGRVLAAQLLGLKFVPTVEASHLSKSQRRAFILADNKLALNAGWDFDQLRDEIQFLQDESFDISVTGFSESELSELLCDQTSGLTDPDEIPDPPEHPVARMGDIFILGNHRLACGDSTNPETVSKLLAGVIPNLMVTDPPYGVEYDASWRKTYKPGADYAVGKVLNDDRADWGDAFALFRGSVAYVWHGALHAGVVEKSLVDAGFEIRSQIIWVKPRLVLGRGNYHWQHEPCWYAVRKGSKSSWSGDRKQTTIWGIAHNKSETGHSTQKPVEAMRRPIENNSSPGQAVYEPFCGSGTTIIAAEQTGRCCYAVELSPEHVDVAIQRWENFTGKQAVLDGDGMTFCEIKSLREQHGE